MKRIAIALTALAVAVIGGINHYSGAAKPAHDPAAAAAIAAVQAPDRYGVCLLALEATSPTYKARDAYVPHAPATVRYAVRGGELVFSVMRNAKARGGMFTVPADPFTVQALGTAGC
jgi:hypothetical protein